MGKSGVLFFSETQCTYRQYPDAVCLMQGGACSFWQLIKKTSPESYISTGKPV